MTTENAQVVFCRSYNNNFFDFSENSPTFRENFRKISKSVNPYLQHHTQALPSYVKDSSDFIKNISKVKENAKDSIIVTMDVISLYTNIPNHEGIEAVKKVLNKQVGRKTNCNKVIVNR